MLWSSLVNHCLPLVIQSCYFLLIVVAMEKKSFLIGYMIIENKIIWICHVRAVAYYLLENWCFDVHLYFPYTRYSIETEEKNVKGHISTTNFTMLNSKSITNLFLFIFFFPRDNWVVGWTYAHFVPVQLENHFQRASLHYCWHKCLSSIGYPSNSLWWWWQNDVA